MDLSTRTVSTIYIKVGHTAEQRENNKINNKREVETRSVRGFRPFYGQY